MSDVDKPETSPKADSLVFATRKAALSAMSRIFKRNLSTQVKKWQYFALPERKLELINQQFSETFKEGYEYVAKMGAIDSISKLNEKNMNMAKSKAFRTITQHMFHLKT
jgi:hypothetical protein